MIGEYMTIFVRLQLVLFCGLYAKTISTSITTVKPSGDNISIQLENDVDAPDKVSYVEGTRLNITCISDSFPTKISWTKQLSTIQSGISLVLSLTLPAVRKSDTGLYTCEVYFGSTVYKRSINVDILFPPGLPDIQGPGIVIMKDPFSLTCKVDSNPSPSYWWTFGEGDNATIEKRGESFEITLYEWVYDVAVYCWAESTMFPTVGGPVTRKANGVKRILVHEHARVWSLEPSVYVNTGEDVYIKCDASGEPDPKVYFTKQDDPSFAQSGRALTADNVRLEFDGLYACNAENTVSPTGKDDQFTSQRMYSRVVVRDPNITSNCSDFCLPGTNAVVCSPQSATSMPLKHGDQCDQKCSVGMIAVIASGWLAAVLVLAVGLIMCLLKKRNGKDDRTCVKEDPNLNKVQINNQSQNSRLNSMNNRVTDSTERQQRDSEMPYDQIAEENVSPYFELQETSSPYFELQETSSPYFELQELDQKIIMSKKPLAV